MEKKAYPLYALGLGLAVVIGIVLAHLIGRSSGYISSNISLPCIAYSASCPHCHHLIEDSRRFGLNASLVQGRQAVECLSYAGLKWDGSVPWLVINGYAMRGYPSDSQDHDGYFISASYEESLCRKMGWKPVYRNGTYEFCMNGSILMGNRHALEWLISKTK